MANIVIPDGGTVGSTSDTDAISISSSGAVTLSSDFVPATPLSHRNLIINGGMQVAQRGTALTQVTNADYSTLDRWKFWENTDGTYQTKQNTVTDLPGFTNSLYLSPDGYDTSIDAGQYAFFAQLIEAQNLQHLAYGTASAKTMTLSFYIKSNLTGKMTVYVAKYDNTVRIVPLEFDLPSSSGTWERITLTVPALTDTSAGVINNDNGMGLEIGWYMTAGSTYKVGTSGTWSSNSNGYSTANHNVNFMSDTSNYIEITGVQLELGSVATPFEHRTFADELRRCQRYYERTYNYGTATGGGSVSTALYAGSLFAGLNGTGGQTTGWLHAQFRDQVEKRAMPTTTLYDTAGNVNKLSLTIPGTSTTHNKTAGTGDLSTNSISVYRSSGTSDSASSFYVHLLRDAEL